ncbi:MAG: glycosyltransferase family 4 protein [Bryobacteraceae bacterium]
MSAPIRVLLVAPSLDITGGQAVQAVRLVRELSGEPEIEISFLPMNPRLPGWVRRIPYLRTVVNFLVFVAQLAARIRGYDILHLFSAGYFSFLMAPAPGMLMARLCGKKSILNYRDGRAEDHLRRWPLARRLARLADAIVSPSAYVAAVFGSFGFPCRTIHNIIDLDQFRYRARRRLRPVFLANRGLEPLYNVACVLRAFARIQQRYPEARLTVAHDGPCRRDLEALAVELKLRHCEFVGRVPQERIVELCDQADVYLTAPDIDCMPGSLLECFASGLPVVATEAGGIPYMVEHERTGLLIPRNDDASLAAQAMRLLEDEELVERITSNARAECENYRWSRIREQWLGLYRELMRS